ncbi:uncharacterized protein LOC133184799 [Saccostrea echinata]|uniref:uncharacterized protein LOC133184799 n=1 Tax=Saccostrea echinata TaxID=191078 RepID=UPI002A7F72C3|nr:uncharacterized protein LOC133184799 [Saccostrea echinata]
MASICKISLIVEHKITMLHPKAGKVIPYGGKLYPYDIDLKTATKEDIIPNDEVIIANGIQKPLVVFNGTLPGPDIIVYEGQTLFIKVTNKLPSEILGIHWHGMHQRNTPFMDGVPFVTQCPILPGQSFTYKFQAYPKGTFWYYSTAGSQRINGAFGALIVRPKLEDDPEHILQVQDWYDGQHETDVSPMASSLYIDTFNSPKKSTEGTFSPDNALINGRGGGKSIPFHVFIIRVHKSETSNPFRTINVGATLPFRISIDGHTLRIIGSNGYSIKSLSVDSFIIYPGERIEFTVKRINPGIQNFWIRAEAIETVNKVEVRAILRYKGAHAVHPNTSKKFCTLKDLCLVFNCPFKHYPEERNTKCITIDQADSREPSIFPQLISKRHFKEYFLNFRFSGTAAASINGRQFLFPQGAALTQPNSITKPCTKAQCSEEKLCQCTNSLSLYHNETVHLVLTNFGLGNGLANPIHLHGHSFELLKMGFPVTDKTNGNIISPNKDIKCKRNIQISKEMTLCSDVVWSDSSWHNGNAPGLNLKNPPNKDTVIIPSGGYVVIRIRANNPGLWLLHSLVDHQFPGSMSILLNESFPYITEPPMNFPKCGNFYDIPTPLH